MPRRKGNRRGHRGRWSSYPKKRKYCGPDSSDDSDGRPESEFFKYDSDNAVDAKAEHKYIDTVFNISKSIVSLASTVDGRHLVSCSGTVVDRVESETWILTSATLVRKPGTQYEAYKDGDVKIKVVLHNKATVEGSLAMCHLHYNLAIIIIRSPVDLPVVELRDTPECYSMQPRPVVALGRNIWSEVLMGRGELIRANCKLDCTELLVSTCDVKEDFIGGLVMDLEDRCLGITFCYKETAPFLPVEIAARCLDYFKKFKDELPWLRIRGHAIHMLDLPVLENMCCKYAKLPSGILVEKISGVSSDNCGGIKVGDAISELDGIVLSSVAQFTSMFLDKMAIALGTQNTVTLQAFVQRRTDQTTFVSNLNVQEVFSNECDQSFQNRWPLRGKK